MKTIVLLCVLLLSWSTASAEEVSELKCPKGLKWLSGGCYTIPNDGRGRRMIVHTWKPMMQHKYATWTFQNRESKEALETTKILHEKLMGIPAVNGIQVEDRMIIISVYLLDKVPVEAISKVFESTLK